MPDLHYEDEDGNLVPLGEVKSMQFSPNQETDGLDPEAWQRFLDTVCGEGFELELELDWINPEFNSVVTIEDEAVAFELLRRMQAGEVPIPATLLLGEQRIDVWLTPASIMNQRMDDRAPVEFPDLSQYEEE